MRNDLKEPAGASLPLMPEGFEKVLTPQGSAGFIACVASDEQKR